MKYFFLLITSLITFHLVQGQTATKEKRSSQIYGPKIALKFSPLPLMDYTPAIQMGVEIKTGEKQAIHIDYGYITDLHNDRDFSGMKLRGEYRFYKALENEPNILKFRGFQYLYKQVLDPTNSFVWKNNRTYQELVSYKILSRINSIYAVGGFAFNTHKPVGFEASFGLGYRRFQISLKDVPEDAEVSWRNNRSIFQPSGPGVFHMPGIFFNGRIVWRIK